MAEKKRRGRKPADPASKIRNYRLMPVDLEHIAFVLMRRRVSETDAIRHCIRRTRQIMELDESTGLYTKDGDEFVRVRLL